MHPEQEHQTQPDQQAESFASGAPPVPEQPTQPTPELQSQPQTATPLAQEARQPVQQYEQQVSQTSEQTQNPFLQAKPSHPDEPEIPASVNPTVAEQPATHTDGFGIASIIMAILMPLIGIILGAIGMSQARKEGRSSTLSKTGLILSVVIMAINTVLAIVIISLSINNLDTTITTVGQIEQAEQKSEAYLAAFASENESDFDTAQIAINDFSFSYLCEKIQNISETSEGACSSPSAGSLDAATQQEVLVGNKVALQYDLLNQSLQENGASSIYSEISTNTYNDETTTLIYAIKTVEGTKYLTFTYVTDTIGDLQLLTVEANNSDPRIFN